MSPVSPLPRDLATALIAVIRERMDEQGLSGNKLAQQTGMSQPSISVHFRGQGNFTLDEFDAMAVAVGDDLESMIAAARRRL